MIVILMMMLPMTQEEILKRLEEIEARAAKATPGPWKWVLDDDPINFCAEELVDPEGKPVIGVDEYLIDISPDDAEFITHAREDVPWLCQVVRKLLENENKHEQYVKSARGMWVLAEYHGRPTLIELTSGAEVYVDQGKRHNDPWVKSWTAVLCYAHPDREVRGIARFDTVEEAERALLTLADEVKAFKLNWREGEKK